MIVLDFNRFIQAFYKRNLSCFTPVPFPDVQHLQYFLLSL